jgi:phenylpropionate dioxygenase-like ring-hydroxylating dioxygenase large terminal subunit
VAIRAGDRVLRVLSRVCRHRYMPLLESGSGRARSLQCPYHRWSYGLDGRLLGAPDMQRTPGFERKQIALPSLPVEVWHGFVFTTLDPSASPLAPRLESLAERIAPWEIAGLRTLEPLVFEHDWNWKIMVENFIESYHHQGPHLDSLQTIAPASGTWAEDVDGPFIALHNPSVDGAALPTLFPTRPKLSDAQRGEFLVTAIFPHLLFSLQPDGMFWYRMEPQAVDRFRLSIHPCLSAEAAEDPGYAERVGLLRGYVDAIHREDIGACTGVQRGVHARLAQAGPLSHLEKPIAQFHRWLAS